MFKRFKKSLTHLQSDSPEISPEMQHIYDALINHLNMNTSGALLITGEWGSGKTFYIKKVLFPKIEQEKGIIPIIVSLYGVTDKAGIATKVFFAYLDKIGGGKFLSSATWAKGAHNILESVQVLKKYIDVNKLFAASGEDLFRFLPKEGLLICFDDLERISSKINSEDFLGMVNELVENKGNKVLIIANEEVINGGIKFKEKTIEKTIHFNNDMSAILDSLLTNYEGQSYQKYLSQNKDFIIKSIKSNHDNDVIAKELRVTFANIRTLKFALEHFRLVYEIISKSLDIKDVTVLRKLKGCWLFILSVSAEFKKPNNITYTKRHKLDFTLLPINANDIANISDDTKNTQTEWSFRNAFVDKYFKRLSEPYVYMPEIYNLITAGQTIDSSIFLKDMETSYQVKTALVNAAQELLSKFLHQGYWTFKDEEIKPALEQLMEFGEEGKFDDVISFLNAGVYLLGFSKIIEVPKEVITTKLKTGLGIQIKNINNSISVGNELDMISGHFDEEHLQQLIVFIKEQFKAKEKEEITNEVVGMEDLFVNDLTAFIKQLLPKNIDMRSPDKLLFNQFSPETIDKALKFWQPADIMNLTSYFKIRYIDPSFAEWLTDEIPFLELLKQKFENYNASGKPLSAQLVNQETIPRINECIKKLNSFKKSIISEAPKD